MLAWLARTIPMTCLVPALLPALIAAAASAGDAAVLHRLLEGSRVTLPDGSSAPVVAPEDGSAPGLLSLEDLGVCLDTVTEGGAWPALWLVVQRQDDDFDLVLRLERDGAGSLLAPEFAFAVPRREWDPRDLKEVVRDATGRRPPRKGLGNLVIQGFSRRIEQSYVYRAPEFGPDARGLAALLPQGSLIREARYVDPGDGRRHTVALILRDAEFVPSDCTGCSALQGHVDSGTVTAVLTDDRDLLSTLDLTTALAGPSGSPRLPRYRCLPEDRDPAPGWTFGQRFASRARIPLIEFEDLDGDGRALEFALPAGAEGCEPPARVVVALDPLSRTLRLLEPRETRR